VTTVSASTTTARRLPGQGRLPLAIVIVTLIGLLDASYLTYIHYHGLGGLLCLGAHHGHSSCETVQSSSYSKLDGVPVALIGLIGYVAILGSLLVPGDLGRASTFGIALIGFGFSAYLTYRELFSIHAICEWCVGSAVCLTALTVLTAVRFVRSG
jgi:uncharacterized membrane protein